MRSLLQRRLTHYLKLTQKNFNDVNLPITYNVCLWFVLFYRTKLCIGRIRDFSGGCPQPISTVVGVLPRG